MSEPTVVGLQPWLPWPLSAMRWWTEPVRAERLAALRIGVGVALLIDALGHYWPYANVFLGDGSLGGAEVFPAQSAQVLFLRSVHSAWHVQAALLLWAASGVCLALGLWSRVSAAVAWVLGVSLVNTNPYLINSGDNVRDLLLFYLMLSPCGAAWALDGRRTRQGPVFIAPWALRLLFVQMAVIYFVGGAYKALFPQWRDGSAMYYHLANLAWTRVPYEWLPWPQLVVPAFSWTALTWELGFPLLVAFRPTRAVTLWLGVLFHIGTGLLFQIGAFPFYMLCFYLPLVPWERYERSEKKEPDVSRTRQRRSGHPQAGSARPSLARPANGPVPEPEAPPQSDESSAS